jgi:outer membrane lipoprotein-sorting protein
VRRYPKARFCSSIERLLGHESAVLNILRRLPLSRLLLLCALVVAIGVSATALAFALGSGPTPPPKPLAQAVHDALAAPSVEGFSANVQLTDHLLEGANLASGASGGGSDSLTSNPLLTGASGRLWVANDGRMRIELQSEEGDTQVIYDGQTLSVYDAASNTLYRLAAPAPRGKCTTSTEGQGTPTTTTLESCAEKSPLRHEETPSVAKIEQAIAKLQHVTLSGATPTDVAGQPAYTLRVSPKESGSLLGGAELSWDANNGVPLRAAVYSSTDSAPVIELASSDVSFGPVASSVFEFTPPPNAKIEEVKLSDGGHAHAKHDSNGAGHPAVTTHGSGVTAVDVLESKAKPGTKPLELPEELPKVKIGEANAAELSTALGTLLGFERSGVRYLLVGAVTPAQIEAVARGL